MHDTNNSHHTCTGCSQSVASRARSRSDVSASTSGGYGLVILNPRGVWTAVSFLLKVSSGGPLLSAAPCCRSSLPCLSRVHQCTRFRSPSLPDSHSPPSSPPLPDLKSLPGQAGLRFGRWVLQRLVPFAALPCPAVQPAGGRSVVGLGEPEKR